MQRNEWEALFQGGIEFCFDAPQWLVERAHKLLTDLASRSVRVAGGDLGKFPGCGVSIRESSPGNYAVSAAFEAERPIIPLHAAAACMDVIARGHRALIRVSPEQAKFHNFDKDVDVWRAYVRFHVFDEEGEWLELVWSESSQRNEEVRYRGFR